MDDEISIAVLQHEVEWLQKVIDQVIRSYLMQDGHENSWLDIPMQDLADVDCPYAVKVKEWNADVYTRLTLALTIAPHIRPEVLDIFFGKNQLYDRGFTEFGGVTEKNHSGFLPTAQTLCFLISATDPSLFSEVNGLLDKSHCLMKEEVITLGETEAHLPRFNGVLSLNQRWLTYFLTGTHVAVEQSAGFPAQRISTPLNWNDIVLDDHIMEQVQEINAWLEHGKTLMKEWGLENKIKPGYRALFYGPPGTGKTLTATLLGKASGRDVYKIDLSLVVSKYIGETEKNLSKIFDIAQDRNWILFFDEADALFGKRTSTSSSNDRYANQQTAYLLQRIEDFPGVVILATNLNSNMDEAFSRRFQSAIHFTMPSSAERLQLWQNAFAGSCEFGDDVDLEQISEEYELAGGAIINVLRHCALGAVRRNSKSVSRHDLLNGIRKEFKKENKTIAVTT